MLVVVHAGRHAGVIVVPFRLSDGAVAVLVTERGEELSEDLVGGHLTALNLGVHASVVNSLEVAGLNALTAITVELAEGSVDSLLADLIGSSADTEKELIEVDVTVLVGVEAFEEASAFVL